MDAAQLRDWVLENVEKTEAWKEFAKAVLVRLRRRVVIAKGARTVNFHSIENLLDSYGRAAIVGSPHIRAMMEWKEHGILIKTSTLAPLSRLQSHH